MNTNSEGIQKKYLKKCRTLQNKRKKNTRKF